MKVLGNRFIAGGLGIGAALLLAVTQGGGQGGLALWPLFGTTNQLVAGVTLLIVSVWLKRMGRQVAYTLVPMIGIGGVTVFAMLGNLVDYFADFEQLWLLAVAGSIVLVLDIWVMLEGIRVLVNPDADESARPLGNPRSG